MRTHIKARCLIGMPVFLFFLVACESGEEAFVGDRLHILCDEAYTRCNTTCGCILDQDHYIEGVFPGTRRIVVVTDEVDTQVQVRVYFSSMESPGSELLIQLYEEDCTLNTELGRVHLVDVDLFEKAGDDRTLTLDLKVSQIGEHLLEIYADASTEYVLITELD